MPRVLVTKGEGHERPEGVPRRELRHFVDRSRHRIATTSTSVFFRLRLNPVFYKSNVPRYRQSLIEQVKVRTASPPCCRWPHLPHNSLSDCDCPYLRDVSVVLNPRMCSFLTAAFRYVLRTIESSLEDSRP